MEKDQLIYTEKCPRCGGKSFTYLKEESTTMECSNCKYRCPRPVRRLRKGELGGSVAQQRRNYYLRIRERVEAGLEELEGTEPHDRQMQADLQDIIRRLNEKIGELSYG